MLSSTAAMTGPRAPEWLSPLLKSEPLSALATVMASLHVRGGARPALANTSRRQIVMARLAPPGRPTTEPLNTAALVRMNLRNGQRTQQQINTCEGVRVLDLHLLGHLGRAGVQQQNMASTVPVMIPSLRQADHGCTLPRHSLVHVCPFVRRVVVQVLVHGINQARRSKVCCCGWDSRPVSRQSVLQPSSRLQILGFRPKKKSSSSSTRTSRRSCSCPATGCCPAPGAPRPLAPWQ